MVRLNVPAVETKYQDLKNAVADLPGVMGVTGTSFAGWEYGQLIKDFPINGIGGPKHVNVMVVDCDYLKVCGIPLVQGQGFTDKINTTRNTQLIVNEAAQKELGFGMDSFIFGEPLTGRVVGVTGNFDYVFPARGMKPLVLTMRSPFLINTSYTPSPVHLSYLLVKTAPGEQQKTIKELEELWKKMNPGYSFDYKLMEYEISNQLDEINRSFESVLYASTILAFLLSGLGLFGLASFEMERRTKEVGIRKAVGATSWQIVAHFLLGFLKLVAIANVVAWPLTFILVRMVFGLLDYPHPLVIGPLVFLKAGVISVAVMAVTVGAQTLRAAMANPVNSLRYE
jgi:putative ABC transport system permease protein